MDASLDFALDVPWFVAYAAEPFELLRVVHPSLNASTLPPPTNPIRLERRYFNKRASCGTTNDSGNGNNTGGTTPSEKKSNSGVLIGAVVGSVLGTLLLAVLAFWLYRRSQRKKQQQQNNNNNNNSSNLNTPFKEDPPAMPTPFLVHGHPGVGGGTPPPGMKPVSPYDTPGLPYTPAMYPGAPSTIGSGPGSSYGGQTDGGSYYNYAPPPPTSPQPTISSGMGMGMGVGYYSSTPAPPFPSTPSPPPPSTTPGAVSTHSAYQPWAVPMGMDTSGHDAGSSSNVASGGFPEEKAHYSRWQNQPPTAGSGSGSMSEKASPSGKHPRPNENVGPSAGASGTNSGGREGAMSPGVGVSGRDGALSPTPALPPPAYSPE